MVQRAVVRIRKLSTAKRKAAGVVELAVRRQLRRGWAELKPLVSGLVKVDGGPFFSPDDPKLWGAWADEFDQEVNRAMLEGAELILDVETGWWRGRGYEDVVFDPQEVIDANSKRVGRKITGVVDTTRDWVSGAIRQWYDTDDDMDMLVTQLQAYFSPWRARLIGITETTSLASTVSHEVMGRVGSDRWVWDSRDDWLVCTLCSQLHGMTFNIDDAMPPEGSHPGCRCGTSPILPGDAEEAE